MSGAFAEAEANGNVVTVEDLSASGSPATGKQDSRPSSAPSSGSKSNAGDGMVDIVDDQGRDDADGSDEDLDVPTKKMGNLSLEARLKGRRKGTTSAASQVILALYSCISMPKQTLSVCVLLFRLLA